MSAQSCPDNRRQPGVALYLRRRSSEGSWSYIASDFQCAGLRGCDRPRVVLPPENDHQRELLEESCSSASIAKASFSSSRARTSTVHSGGDESQKPTHALRKDNKSHSQRARRNSHDQANDSPPIRTSFPLAATRARSSAT